MKPMRPLTFWVLAGLVSLVGLFLMAVVVVNLFGPPLTPAQELAVRHGASDRETVAAFQRALETLTVRCKGESEAAIANALLGSHAALPGAEGKSKPTMLAYTRSIARHMPFASPGEIGACRRFLETIPVLQRLWED